MTRQIASTSNLLTYERVMEIIRVEQENGTLHGVIVQFGGQTPLKLAKSLRTGRRIPILRN